MSDVNLTLCANRTLFRDFLFLIFTTSYLFTIVLLRLLRKQQQHRLDINKIMNTNTDEQPIATIVM